MKNYIFIFLSFLPIICSAQKNISTDWEKDLEYLKTELPKKHIDLFFQRDKAFFESEMDELKIQANKLSDFEIALKLQQLIAKMGDSHSGIEWSSYIKKDKIIPVSFLWFKDGIYIIKTSSNNENILGKKIKGINGTDIDEIVKKFSTLLTIDNQAIVKKNIPYYLTLIQLLEYFDIVENDKVEFQIENSEGRISNQIVIIEPMYKSNQLSVNLKSIPHYLQNERKYFWSEYIKENNIYYIQYNKCMSKEAQQKYGDPDKAENLPSFTEFENEVFSTIKEKKINKLIFDMRFNSGGSSPQGTAFVEKLAKIENINQKGRLFVIIGRRTFSSAIINTIDFKKNTSAIIVGEETSGKPNHYGEVKNFILPLSKLKIFYSTNYFERVKNDIGTIKPDMEIETSFNDFINGVDPIFEWIKNQ